MLLNSHFLLVNFKIYFQGRQLRVLENMKSFTCLMMKSRCVDTLKKEEVIPYNKDGEMMVWHYRLSHPSLLYLKHFFPSLLKNKDVSYFLCEIC